MNESESSDKPNDDYERQREETNKAILYQLQGFSRLTIQTSVLAFIATVIYMVFFACKTDVNTCIKETGTSAPLFILASTIVIEGKGRIMDWIEVRRAKRKDEKEQREAKLRAEGKAEGRQELLKELEAKGVDVSKIESKPQD